MKQLSKLTRNGNSTTVTLSPDILAESKMTRGDEVTVEAKEGQIIITRTGDDYAKGMSYARELFSRYRRTFEKLAK